MFIIVVYPNKGSLKGDLEKDGEREEWFYREYSDGLEDLNKPTLRQWAIHERDATRYGALEAAESKALLIAASHEVYIGRILIRSFP